MVTRAVFEPRAVLSSWGFPPLTAVGSAQLIDCHGVEISATWFPDVQTLTSAGCSCGGAAVNAALSVFLSTTVPVTPFRLSRPACLSSVATLAVSVCGRLNVSLYAAPPIAPAMPCAATISAIQPAMTNHRRRMANSAMVFICAPRQGRLQNVHGLERTEVQSAFAVLDRAG